VSREALIRHAATAFVVLAATAVFARTAGHGFLIWDDRELIIGNPVLASPSLGRLATLWTTPLLDIYVPLTCTLWALVSAVFGVVPRAFHVVNVVLHALNAWAVLALLRELLPAAEPAAVLAGALVFAVHPVQAETVAWASETKDLLSALCALIAMREYLVFRRRGDGRRYALASLASVAALLAKPSAVVTPLLVLVLDRWRNRGPWAGTVRALAPWFVATAVFTMLFRRLQPAMQAHYVAPLWVRPLLALDAIGFYASTIVFPVGLIPDYGRTSAALVANGAIAYSGIPAAVLLAATWLLRRSAPALALAVALFVGGLLPVLGLVRFDFQYYSNVADHYLYLPMIGPAIGIALAWPRLPRSVRVVGVPAVIVALFVLSFRQAAYWKSDETLYARTLAVNPASVMAHVNRGELFDERGDLAAAIADYRAALVGDPGNQAALNNIGWALYRHGEYDAAIRHYTEVLGRTAPLTKGTARMHNNLGAVYLKTRRYEDALLEFQRAMAIDPGYLDPYYNLGIVLMDLGRYADAVPVLQKGLTLAPGHPALRRQLSIAVARSGG